MPQIQITSLIFFILSHGANDTFKLNDDAIAFEDFISQFDRENCRALKSKPKLFFFQLCRSLLLKFLCFSFLTFYLLQLIVIYLFVLIFRLEIKFYFCKNFKRERSFWSSTSTYTKLMNILRKIFSNFIQQRKVRILLFKDKMYIFQINFL